MLFGSNIESEKNILYKRGTIISQDGVQFTIMNEKGKYFRVNGDMIWLWNMCKGVSFNDLLFEYRRISSSSDEEIKHSLYTAIHLMESYSVVKVKKN